MLEKWDVLCDVVLLLIVCFFLELNLNFCMLYNGGLMYCSVCDHGIM